MVAALDGRSQDLPAAMRGSLTWDRGVQMNAPEDVNQAIGLPVYFCDAYSPRKRRSNENASGIIRQHFPKTDCP